MSARAILVFCIQAFFIQIAVGQQCNRYAALDGSRFSTPYGIAGISQASPAMGYDTLAAPGLAYNGWAGRGLPEDRYYSPGMEFTVTNGGGLPVTSISSISPTGIFVTSNNAYEGPVIVTGELPFVSAVAMEGNVPSTGAGGIEYGCGNGIVAMLNEGPVPSGSIRPGGYSPGPNVAFGLGGGVGSSIAMGLDNGFGPSASFRSPAGFANANKLGYGNCGYGMMY